MTPEHAERIGTLVAQQATELVRLRARVAELETPRYVAACEAAKEAADRIADLEASVVTVRGQLESATGGLRRELFISEEKRVALESLVAKLLAACKMAQPLVNVYGLQGDRDYIQAAIAEAERT